MNSEKYYYQLKDSKLDLIKNRVRIDKSMYLSLGHSCCTEEIDSEERVNNMKSTRPAIKGVLIDTNLALEIVLSRDEYNSEIINTVDYIKSLVIDNVSIYITSLCVQSIFSFLYLRNPREAENAIIYLEDEFKVQAIDIDAADISGFHLGKFGNFNASVEYSTARRNYLNAIVTISPNLYDQSFQQFLTQSEIFKQTQQDIYPSDPYPVEPIIITDKNKYYAGESLNPNIEKSNAIPLDYFSMDSYENKTGSSHKIFLDKNFLLEVFLCHPSNAEKVDRFITLIQMRPDNSFHVFVTDFGLENLRFYLKIINPKGVENAIIWLEKNFNINIIHTYRKDIKLAREMSDYFSDELGCLLEIAASKRSKVDAIATCHPRLYRNSHTPILLIDETIQPYAGGYYYGKNFSGRDLSGEDLSRTNLCGANLEGANLSRTNLSGSELRGANLKSANLEFADLERANLEGAYLEDANLRGANLRSATLQHARLLRVDLCNANLIGSNLNDADLQEANMRGVNLNNSLMKRVNLENADLRPDPKNSNCITQMICVKLCGANLKGAKLNQVIARRTNFREANLQNADLSNTKLLNTNFEDSILIHTNLSSSDMGGAILTNAKMTGANLSFCLLRGASLRNADLSKANLEKSELQGAFLKGANLSQSNLSYCIAYRANFNEANLEKANLEKADLSNSSFKKTNISRGNLRSTNLEGANLTEANLSEANLSWAILTGSSMKKANLEKANLSHAQLQAAYLKCANISYADIHHANLNRARLKRANLIGANLTSTTIKGVDLRCSNLQKAIFYQAHIEDSNLSGANLTSSNLQESKIVRSNLLFSSFAEADLSKANLSNIDLSAVNMEKAKFTKAYLVNTRFCGANLSNSVFTDANLSKANLNDTNLTGAILLRAIMKYSSLCGSNLTAADLTSADLEGAYSIGSTFLGVTTKKANITYAYIRYAKFKEENWDLLEANLKIIKLNQINDFSDFRETLFFRNINNRLYDAQISLELFSSLIEKIELVKDGFSSKTLYQDSLIKIKSLSEYIESAKKMELLSKDRLDEIKDEVLLLSPENTDEFNLFIVSINDFIGKINYQIRSLGEIYFKPYGEIDRDCIHRMDNSVEAILSINMSVATSSPELFSDLTTF